MRERKTTETGTGFAPSTASGRAAPVAEAAAEGSEPVTRAELELALRASHLMVAELREDLHALAAQVVALTELAAAPEDRVRFEAEVGERTAVLRQELALSDLSADGRLLLAAPEDKYDGVSDDGPACEQLLPLCGARCCRFEVALSTQDLDEGKLRWNYATPYALAKHADGQCVHHDSTGCTVYAVRPATCRRYDCRSDPRVWLDYERGIVAPMPAGAASSSGEPGASDQPGKPGKREGMERQARERALAHFVEASRLRRRP